jgi:IclR family KDG regulon transcriptional repressor
MEDNVRVIDRVLDIIETLAHSNKPLRLSEIVAATDMSKSTVHRLLSSLLRRQYVSKTSDGKYTIGFQMIEAVSYHINSLELLTEAKPVLNSLLRELDLTAHLGILDGPDVVYLEKMDVYPGTRIYTQVGYRSPAFCSSIGKCLLSGLSGDELEEALYVCEFKQYTKNTITDIREFKRHLLVVRKQGWAMDNEEYQIGHRCIGAPIYDYRGVPVAAISASGSIANITQGRQQEIIRHVRDSAAVISRQMGYIE